MDVALVNPVLRTSSVPSVFGTTPPIAMGEPEVRNASITELGQALADLGHRVTIYAADVYLKEPEYVLNDRLSVVGVPTHLRRVFNPALVAFTPKIGAILQRRPVDVIQSGDFYQMTTRFSAVAAARLGVPFVVWQEPFRHMRTPGQWYERGLDWVSGREMRAGRQRFVPRTIRARGYLESLGIPPDAIAPWIPNGVNGAVFRPQERTLRGEDFGLPNGIPLALVVARLSPEKGVDLAVRAMAILRDSGARVGLIIRGDGPDRARLEAMVREWHLEDLVRIGVSSRAELVDLYNSCDLAIVPSRRDLLPYALIEAGACGLPAVATRAGCSDDFVRDGENGVLVAPESPEEIAREVGRLVSDDALRRRMGAAARERFLHDFELSAVAARFAGLYHDLKDHAAE
jgi:glycosyltransferase involved in cell wall biosynthesis